MNFLRYDPDSSDDYKWFSWKFIGLCVLVYVGGLIAAIAGVFMAPNWINWHTDADRIINSAGWAILATLCGIPVIAFAILYRLTDRVRREEHVVYQGILAFTCLPTVLIIVNSTSVLVSTIFGGPTLYTWFVWALVVVSSLGVVLTTAKAGPRRALLFAMLPLLAWAVGHYHAEYLS
jgi:hypothetical protein